MIIYFLNIFISLGIGYFFHVCLHYVPFLKEKHEVGHHSVYDKKFKTKTYVYNEENNVNFFKFSFDVEYLIFIYLFIGLFYITMMLI